MEEKHLRDFVSHLDADGDLSHQSWTAVTYLQGRWAAKMCQSRSGVVAMITNFERAYIDDGSTLQHFKTLNPNVEGSSELLCGWLFDIILARRKSEVKALTQNDRKLTIRYEANISELPVVWEFRGHRCDEHTFYQQVTEPMLLLISQLSRREEALMSMLEQKDQLIEELGGRKDGTDNFLRTEWTDKDIYSQDSIALCRQFSRTSSVAPFDQLLVRHLYEKSALTFAYAKANSEPPSNVLNRERSPAASTNAMNNDSAVREPPTASQPPVLHEREEREEPRLKKKKPLRL
uniref:XLF N-terminal domain-containing protein n=1 Tax=Plectus sambesii TaxID=2011161 RepID=A0A914UM88_9BILA